MHKEKCREINMEYKHPLYYKKHDPEFYNMIMAKGHGWQRGLFDYVHNIKEVPPCECCGGPTTFHSFKKGYNRFCSKKCISLGTRAKAKETMMKRYGGIGLAGSTASKIKKTMIERYGTINPNKLDAIKNKIMKTMVERYGGMGFGGSTNSKIKKTMEERYGVTNPNKSDAIKNKIMKTMVERYGGMGFGGDAASKIRETMMERYGADHPMKINDIKSKVLSSYQKGQISKHDFLIGYTQDGERICTCPHPECNKCEEKTYIIDGHTQNYRRLTHAELCTKLLPPQPQWSSLEVRIRQWLDEMGVNYTTNDRQFGLEMDIYIPSLKLAIEVNGSYWHSLEVKSMKYHINKSLLLSDHGIRCIFVWDDYKDEDIHNFISAIIKGQDLSPWIKKWFPNIKGWPADFGLIDGDWIEHKCMHGDFECYDAGVIQTNI